MNPYHWLAMDGWPTWAVATRNVVVLTLVVLAWRRRRQSGR